MMWKKFMREWQLVTAWLYEQNYVNIERIVLNIMILIMRRVDSPDCIISHAVRHTGSYVQLVTKTLDNDADIKNMPDSIRDILCRWIALLPDDGAFLGEIYQQMAIDRRKRGLYYTPVEVIDYIMTKTVDEIDVLVNPMVKVLDPACGSGYFLLRAYGILVDKYRQARKELGEKYDWSDWSDISIHRHIIANNLWGSDVDEHAVEIASASLLLKYPDANDFLIPNIIVYDSLKKTGTEDDAHFLQSFWLSRYDYVVGNPPYLSFGLRGTGSLSNEYKEYLRRFYRDSAEYKLSYYVLFMQRGVEMLHEGGKLGFIIPDSFLLGRYYSKIRRYILDHTEIDNLVHLRTEVFKGASTGFSVICVLSKQNNVALRKSRQMNICKINQLSALRLLPTGCNYEQDYFENLPFNRFRLFFDLKIKNLIDSIDYSSSCLGSVLSGHTGIRSKTHQSDIWSNERKEGDWRPGLISGSQISRYGITYRGDWIHINPDKLYKGGWDDKVVRQRKILVRQTGDTLTACIDNCEYYHLNNIHTFILKPNHQDMNLDYMLLLINSRLMSFYYHIVTMEYGRAMAQMDIETLELLPVKWHPGIGKQAPELVELMLDYTKRAQKGDDAAARKVNMMDDYINQLIYRIYDVSQEEIAYIERFETAERHIRKRNKK